MADLESVIASSMDSAGIGGDSDGAAASAPDTTETVETAEVETAAEGDETPAGETPDPADAAVVAGETVAETAPAVVEKKKGSLPLHRHEAILAKARTEHQAALTTAQAELQSLAWAKDPQAQAKLRALDVADTNPEAFARGVMSIPALAEAFKKAVSGMAAPAAETPAPKAAATERPKPDVLLENGSVTYSDEGLQSLLDWNASQAEARILDRVQKQYEERFGPIEKDFHASAQWNKAIDSQRVVLNNAREKWGGFKEHEAAIKAHLSKPGNERMSLETGYREVVIPAMQADRDKIRAEVVKEINGKTAASVPRPVTRPAGKPAGKASTEDVINASLAAAGL